MWTKYNYQGIAFEVDARGAVRWASDWGKLKADGIAAGVVKWGPTIPGTYGDAALLVTDQAERFRQ